MKTINRVIGIISLVALYFIGREFLSLYVKLKAFHPIAALFFLIIIGILLLFFAVIPIARILSLPQFEGPARSTWNERRLIKKRIKKFRKNKFLIRSGFDFSKINDNSEDYQKIIKVFNAEISTIRNKYIKNLFISSSIAQNGFIDAFLILSYNIKVIKEIFTLYGWRATYKDILVIAKNVYYSVAIGGSEGAEYIMEELISTIVQKGPKAIPFLGKFTSSLADGFINAVLLARVAMITENYCKLTYINSARDLCPGAKVVSSTTFVILKPLVDIIITGIKKLAVEKPKEGFRSIFDKLKSHKDIEDDNADIESKKRWSKTGVFKILRFLRVIKSKKMRDDN